MGEEAERKNECDVALFSFSLFHWSRRPRSPRFESQRRATTKP